MYTNYFLFYQLVIRRTIFHISSIILKIIPFTIIILKFVYILFIRHIVLEQLFLEQFRIQDSNLSIEKSRMHRRATIYVVRRLVQCGSDNRHRNDAPRMAFRHVSEISTSETRIQREEMR